MFSWCVSIQQQFLEWQVYWTLAVRKWRKLILHHYYYNYYYSKANSVWLVLSVASFREQLICLVYALILEQTLTVACWMTFRHYSQVGDSPGSHRSVIQEAGSKLIEWDSRWRKLNMSIWTHHTTLWEGSKTFLLPGSLWVHCSSSCVSRVV